MSNSHRPHRQDRAKSKRENMAGFMDTLAKGVAEEEGAG